MISWTSWMRVVVILGLMLLSSCGGGGGGTASAPGTGGTGIYAMGNISGFGSVIVNGVHYDETTAVIRTDGSVAGSADLRIGMVANILGTRSVSGAATGTASAIDVWTIARGTVTSVTSGQFSMMGMTFKTDAATSYSGLNSTTIAINARVSVWGLQASSDASTWRATRVELTSSEKDVMTGLVAIAAGFGSVNGVALSGSPGTALVDGQLVRLVGAYNAASNVFTLESSRAVSVPVSELSGQEAELEGLVTSPPLGGLMKVSGYQVDISSSGGNTQSASLSSGVRVEVKGTWQNGVLRAKTVSLEDEESAGLIEIEGPIQSFSGVDHFVVRGQLCDATGVVVQGGTAKDLVVNTKVHLWGKLLGDRIKVTRLEVDL